MGHWGRMISKWLKGRAKQASVQSIEPGLPDGVTAWAVGDIHGRRDLLEALLQEIKADDRNPEARKVLVFLGDYVDRGAESRGVIDTLAALEDEGRFEVCFLQGNHEAKLLEFLTDPSVGPAWCEYGGRQALESFGLRVPLLSHRKEAWASLSDDLAHTLSKRQLTFLESLQPSFSLGGYFFAHAGARPGVPLDQQTAYDLMWIRSSFLDDANGFEQVVVHGHTPSARPYSDHRRIGIDTKAYESGVLTAVRLEGADREFIQAASGENGLISIRTVEPTSVVTPRRKS